jgi:hypothetical protein
VKKAAEHRQFRASSAWSGASRAVGDWKIHGSEGSGGFFDGHILRVADVEGPGGKLAPHRELGVFAFVSRNGVELVETDLGVIEWEVGS